MAVSFLAREVSDLCIGKPPLRSLFVSATVTDAIAALKSLDDNFVSVWSCDHTKSDTGHCVCVGKICMVDVICYLCNDQKNLSSPSAALKAPVSVLLNNNIPALVVHVEPSFSLVKAIDLMVQGAQNLIVPIRTKSITKRRLLDKPKASPSSPFTTTHKKGQQYCCITQEDIIRFFLSSIAVLSPIAAFSLHDLGLISTASHTINYYSPASAVVPGISRASAEQTAVAVVDEDDDGEPVLIGEISPHILACQNEAVAAAMATLSAGDLMAYIDCGSPPEELVQAVKDRLEEKGLADLVRHLEESLCYNSCTSCCSSSSDEECTVKRAKSPSTRIARRAESLVCNRRSSLVAVMIQAIAHRANYVWVVEEDCSLVGIVTFVDMLKTFRDRLKTME